MAKPRWRRDPMDSMIESALDPGSYIGWNEGCDFLSGLHRCESEIAKLTVSDPARALALYETFLAGCYAKAEEVDDSDGEFGTFAGGLFRGWVLARQASGADCGETARLLLKWMDDDDYGFASDIERSLAKALDRKGLEAFEREVRARFDKASATTPRSGYFRDHWGRVLKTIYAQRRNIAKYLDVAERQRITQADCEAVAIMFEAKRRPADALAWAERGLAMGKPRDFVRGASYKLSDMRRGLLVKLGRGAEALDSAWADYEAEPNKFTYEELLRRVPKAQRKAWHEKAMATAENADLRDAIELWLGAKEITRLAERLDRARDSELEGLSHYVTEPAAERLARSHPAIAAKVFRALCIRIVDAGKSKYYYEALANLEKARDCYLKAGLDAQWNALVAQIRREHHRKSGFMPGLERIAGGTKSGKEPSFLDRARGRWAGRSRL